jgi:hypothetical protein
VKKKYEDFVEIFGFINRISDSTSQKSLLTDYQ